MIKTRKDRIKLPISIVGVLLLIGVSGAQAAMVIFFGDTATGIKDLVVDGTRYNVEFLYNAPIDFVLYGPNLNFDFTDAASAKQATEAVAAALNTEPAVKKVGPQGSIQYLIGYDQDNPTSAVIKVWQGSYFDFNIASIIIPENTKTIFTEFEESERGSVDLDPVASKITITFLKRLIEILVRHSWGRIG